jgi:3-oxoadipate enol-lactonase
MQVVDIGGVRLHIRDEGAGRPVLFLHSLGTDMRLWDKLLARLPGIRAIRMDTRGHGLSDCPAPPYGMGALVRDAEALLDALGVKGAVVVGCSLGGMMAQGLAIKRPDLTAALVLSNTAARIGTAEMWHERIVTVQAGGVAALAETGLARWFPPAFHATDEFAAWRKMLLRTPADGYAGCAAAIAGTDFYTPLSDLRLPVLGIAGSEDGSTPPDLVRETVEHVPGARFALIRGAGHLPMVDKPDPYAEALAAFLDSLPPPG